VKDGIKISTDKKSHPKFAIAGFLIVGSIVRSFIEQEISQDSFNVQLSTNLALFLGTLKYSFLDRAGEDEPIERHLLCLAESVSPVHRLLINGRVPIAVVEDDLD
jgi:hypothetical protein